MGFPRGLVGKESACQCRRSKRRWFNPYIAKIPWRRKQNPLQHSCLENPMDRGVWWGTIHRSQRVGHDWVHTPCHVELIYKVVLVSSVQHSASVIYMFFFRFFSFIDYYNILSRVSCAIHRSLLLIYCIYTSGGGHGNPLQYSCLENLHGQRSLVGYSPLGYKASD